MEKIWIYDTTLRDGAQAEGVSFSLADKWVLLRQLDELHVDYIEAGMPGGNIRDSALFARLAKEPLQHAQVVAFGSTLRVGGQAETDEGLQALLSCGAQALAIFGKSWDFHVREVLKTTPEENLRLIETSIRYLKRFSRTVFFDAEHFFDGFKANPQYALKTLLCAQEAGADAITLCDTNGGSLPGEIEEAVLAAKRLLSLPLGIHCHNDAGLASANTLCAVENGVRIVQGTINGLGERCGNSNLCTLLPLLQKKLGYTLIGERLSLLTSTSRLFSEVCNLHMDETQPFVGRSAFAHKGGMHIDGMLKNSATFEWLSPETVGNERRYLLSDQAGRALLSQKLSFLEEDERPDQETMLSILKEIKNKEMGGIIFEGAETSFRLFVLRFLHLEKQFFDLKTFTVTSGHEEGPSSATALIKVAVEGREEITAAEGDGPVNAMDNALRKALSVFYPALAQLHLVDFKVRVVDAGRGTASMVRVHISSTDGEKVWNTAGVSANVIEASWRALLDSVQAKLLSLTGRSV